jgi:hypothetical protein
MKFSPKKKKKKASQASVYCRRTKLKVKSTTLGSLLLTHLDILKSQMSAHAFFFSFFGYQLIIHSTE